MDKEEKIKKQQKVTEDYYEDCVNELCQNNLASFQETFKSDLESWESFSKKKEAEVRKNVDTLKARLMNGYKALIEEIVRDSQKGKIKGDGIIHP